jgi:hypothetical protein
MSADKKIRKPGQRFTAGKKTHLFWLFFMFFVLFVVTKTRDYGEDIIRGDPRMERMSGFGTSSKQ